MRATCYLFGSRKLLHSPALSFYLGGMPYFGSERIFLLSRMVSILGFFFLERATLTPKSAQRCNVWWCESCYTVPKNRGPMKGDPASIVPGRASNEDIKVHNGLCVSKCLMDELLNGVGEGGMWG